MQALGWNWLRHGDPVIRESLLRRTPLGTSYQDVLEVVRREGWKPDVPKEQHAAVDVHSVTALLGHYWHHHEPGKRDMTYRVDVVACWRFDQSDRLLDVTVQKHDVNKCQSSLLTLLSAAATHSSCAATRN